VPTNEKPKKPKKFFGAALSLKTGGTSGAERPALSRVTLLPVTCTTLALRFHQHVVSSKQAVIESRTL
jgi:hypothetical protein